MESGSGGGQLPDIIKKLESLSDKMKVEWNLAKAEKKPGEKTWREKPGINQEVKMEKDGKRR
jgi:hypothetical protein